MKYYFMFFFIVFALFLCVLGCKKKATSTTSSSIVKHSTSNEKRIGKDGYPNFLESLKNDNGTSLKVIRRIVIDEKGNNFEVYARHNPESLNIDLFLVFQSECIDTFKLCNDCSNLSNFNLLPSKKRLHVVYELRSSGCTQSIQQEILEIKNNKLFVSLDFNRFNGSWCALGSFERIDSTAISDELDLKLLDSLNLCKLYHTEYRRIYTNSNFSKIIQKRREILLKYDSVSRVFYSRLVLLNAEVLVQGREKRMLDGRYLILDNYNNKEGSFSIFINSRWWQYSDGLITRGQKRLDIPSIWGDTTYVMPGNFNLN